MRSKKAEEEHMQYFLFSALKSIKQAGMVNNNQIKNGDINLRGGE